MAFDFGHIVCRSLSLGLIPFFRSYNNTAYCGLETHILNSYTNPTLLAMHVMPPTNNCTRRHYLSCDLGSVMRVLKDVHGTNCLSSNFCNLLGGRRS